MAVAGATPCVGMARSADLRRGSARNVYSGTGQHGGPEALTSTFANGLQSARTRCAQNRSGRVYSCAPGGGPITTRSETNKGGAGQTLERSLSPGAAPRAFVLTGSL